MSETTPSSDFDQLTSRVDHDDVGGAFEWLVEHFRQEKKYTDLFEARKMLARHRLGLPLLYSDAADSVDESQQLQLETELLDACREVGTGLVETGDLQTAWMYLQPLADREYLRKLFEAVPVDEENIDALIEICLGQGVAPEHGYRLVMEHHGTCNSITLFDTQISAMAPEVRSRLAEMLVDHVYGELTENVRRHIAQHETSAPETARLPELIEGRPWLFEGGGHHLDVTHLASAVRIGRHARSERSLRRALELCQYGLQLSEDFQFPGHPPFEDTFRDHLRYYQVLLGIDVEQGLEHFRQKAAAVDMYQSGTAPMETLIYLLAQADRRDEAIRLSIEHLSDQTYLQGIAPRVFEIATEPSQNRLLKEHYRQKGDVLGYAVSCLRERNPDLFKT